MKRKLKSTLAIILSVAVMFTFIPVMGTAATAASKAKVPKNLKCTAKEFTNDGFTKAQADISWNASKGAKGYKIYYKKSGKKKYKVLGTTKETTYTAINLTAGKTYCFKVKAFKKKSKKRTYSGYSKVLKVKVTKSELGVKAYNGNMIGTVSNGVYSYKGIHYAQNPGTPETRWQKPVAVTASDKDVDASEYGKVAFQVPWHSESPSLEEQSEDCLTLDVWTNSPNNTSAKKPVFVWIHGGSNILGGSSDPLYTGQNIIENCGDDVVYVAINYRLNCMGVMNFSQVEGGENYKDSAWLSLYDDIEALRWIQQNIEQFGGDPSQVTIAGESAGGTHVSLLPLMDECEDEHLFNKVIIQSGGLIGTKLAKDTYNPTKVMMDGYKYGECVDLNKDDQYGVVNGLGKGKYPTMDDLANLSEKEMWTLMYYCGCCTWNEEQKRACRVADSTGDYNPFIRGEGVNLTDRFPDTVEGMAKKYEDLDYIDVIIGTTSNEYDYWIGEQSNKYQYDENGNVKTYTALDGSVKPLVDDGALPTDYDYKAFDKVMSTKWNAEFDVLKQFTTGTKGTASEESIGTKFSDAMDKLTVGNTGAQKGISKTAMKGSLLSTQIWAVSSQLIADYHSKSNGETYMYYWKHPSDVPGFNAGHAVELSYVFGVSSDEYYSSSSGTTDSALMDKTMKTWMSFVTDGKPTVANQKVKKWPEYTAEKQKTMVINDTSKNQNWTIEQSPDKEVRDLMTNKAGNQNPITIGEGQAAKQYKSFMDYVYNGIVVKEANQE